MNYPRIDRISIRQRPEGLPIILQSWNKLLFMHRRVPVEALLDIIPERLEIDTYGDTAWIGITPFTVEDARPPFLPPIPWLSDFHEINVRTYVHLDGVPGVWFFSLDANSLAAVAGAQALFHLPYRYADISMEHHDDRIDYSSHRTDESSPAMFRASWKIGEEIGPARPGSIEFFLVERYCLYAADGDKLYRSRIYHEPWQLRKAEFLHCESTMIEAQGIPVQKEKVLLHYSEGVKAEIWAPEEV
jgi:uncharacterized protein YqjF (DUF2071 family)